MRFLIGVATLVLLSAVIILLGGRASAGDPVPGIDISLEQIPGGVVRNVDTSTSTFSATYADLKAGAQFNVKVAPVRVKVGPQGGNLSVTCSVVSKDSGR